MTKRRACTIDDIKPLVIRRSAVATAVAAALAASNALAATFTVTNTNDDNNPGSFRAAMNDAATSAGPDEIVFDPALAGSSIDVSVAFTLPESVTISGLGKTNLTLNQTSFAPLFIVEAADDVDILITDITLNRGAGTTGQFVNHSGPNGSVVIRNSDLTNTASISTAIDGGAIRTSNTSSIVVENSLIDGFTSTATGGALRSFRGDITVTNSVISNNEAVSGGALMGPSDVPATVTISNSLITGNSSTGGPGGALYVDATEGSMQQLEIDSSTFSGNMSDSRGGAVQLRGSANGSVLNATISNSTFTANQGRSGGAIDAGSGGLQSSTVNLEIVNTTISGNSATQTGGGIGTFSEGTMLNIDLLNSTVHNNTAANMGGGIFQDSNVAFIPITLVNTIVAGNTGNNGGNDIQNTVSIDYSLIGDSAGATLTELTPGTSLVDVDPMLVALADNGGPTQTHQLMEGSPAIDSGDNDASSSAVGLPATDQRGDGFTRVRDDVVDVGAIESGTDPEPEPESGSSSSSGLAANPLWLFAAALAGYVAHRRARRSQLS